MELSTTKDAFGRVTKKQKLSSSKTQEVIDQIRQEIESVLDAMRLVNNNDDALDYKTVRNELKASLRKISPLSQLEGAQKELNVALSKYGKLLEKYFHSDISKAYRNMNIDVCTLNKRMANHFYQQGLFEIGDHFVSGVGEPEYADIMKTPFLEMYRILEALQNQDLEPALKWATSNSHKLAQSGSDIVLKLHSMQFVKLLQNGSRDEALIMLEHTCLLLLPVTLPISRSLWEVFCGVESLIGLLTRHYYHHLTGIGCLRNLKGNSAIFWDSCTAVR